MIASHVALTGLSLPTSTSCGIIHSIVSPGGSIVTVCSRLEFLHDNYDAGEVM